MSTQALETVSSLPGCEGSVYVWPRLRAGGSPVTHREGPARSSACSVIALLLAALAPDPSPAGEPDQLGTRFTYQGQVKLSGVPIDGTADFRFFLLDREDGSVIAGPLLLSQVPVEHGLFTVELDFGSTPFLGLAPWLEIAVRFPAGSGGFATLSPRQQITAAPAALFALSAPVGAHGHHSLDASDGNPIDALSVDQVGNTQVNHLLLFTHDQGSILFPTADAVNTPMIFMFAGGTANANRMVLAHSFASQNLGLQYRDSTDEFTFIGGGADVLRIGLVDRRIGIGTGAPVAALDIRGSLHLQSSAEDISVLDTENLQIGHRTAAGVFTERMRLEIDGDVGIGATVATARLHVRTNTANAGGNNTAAFEAPTIGPNASHIHFGATGDWFIRSAANTGKVVVQDSGGAVLVGTGAGGAGGSTFVGINRSSAITGSDFLSLRTPTGATSFGGMYVDTAAATGLPFYGYATNGSARAFHYLDGANGSWKLSLGDMDRVAVQANGNVTIGEVAGNAFVGINRSTRITGSEFFGFRTPTGPGEFGGMYVETGSPTGRPFYGYAAGGLTRAWTYLDAATGNWHVNVNDVDRLTVQADGRVRAARYTYATPKVHVLSIPAEGFQGDAHDVSWSNRFFAVIEGDGLFVAPVHLPDGSVVTGFKAFFYDISDTEEMTCALGRRVHGAIIAEQEELMAQVTTIGTPGMVGIPTTAISNGTIDNVEYGYFVLAGVVDQPWPGFGPVALLSVVITYTTQEAD